MLETTWFILWGVLWAIYFVLDGFDLGLGALMPVLARNESDRRVIYRSIGPFWDGNEVWLITAGGVTFAAFPGTYATMFSALYSALMLILFALILRGAGLGLRAEVEGRTWQRVCDYGFVIGSLTSALLFGVAFANIFSGIPIDADGIFHGSLFTLLNPYGLCGGALFLFLFLVHGSLWLAVKTEGEIQERAGNMAGKLWVALLIAAVVFLAATAFATELYRNYLETPVLFIIPLVVVSALVMTRVFIGKGAWWRAWACSGLTMFSSTMFGVVGMYPSLLPSSLDPGYSLTIHNSSSSPLTLKIMLGVVLVFVPLVVIYQTWVYFLFRDKVEEEGPGYGDDR